MSEPTIQEIKDLIINLDRKFDTKILELDKKIEVNFAELKGDIKELKVDIKRVEEKLEAKMDGIDKRLGNEEFISRSAFTAVVVGVSTGLVKYLFFSTT